MKIIKESYTNFTLFRQQFENLYNYIQNDLHNLSEYITEVYNEVKNKYKNREAKLFIYFLKERLSKSGFLIDTNNGNIIVKYEFNEVSLYPNYSSKYIMLVDDTDVENVTTNKLLKDRWETYTKDKTQYKYGAKYGDYFESIKLIYDAGANNVRKEIDNVLEDRGDIIN